MLKYRKLHGSAFSTSKVQLFKLNILWDYKIFRFRFYFENLKFKLVKKIMDMDFKILGRITYGKSGINFLRERERGCNEIIEQ